MGNKHRLLGWEETGVARIGRDNSDKRGCAQQAALILKDARISVVALQYKNSQN